MDYIDKIEYEKEVNRQNKERIEDEKLREKKEEDERFGKRLREIEKKSGLDKNINDLRELKNLEGKINENFNKFQEEFRRVIYSIFGVKKKVIKIRGFKPITIRNKSVYVYHSFNKEDLDGLILYQRDIINSLNSRERKETLKKCFRISKKIYREIDGGIYFNQNGVKINLSFCFGRVILRVKVLSKKIYGIDTNVFDLIKPFSNEEIARIEKKVLRKKEIFDKELPKTKKRLKEINKSLLLSIEKLKEIAGDYLILLEL